MKKIMALLATMLILGGCGGTKDAQNDLLKIRQEISGKECTFLAGIHADFGEDTYNFKLNCQFDVAGNMTFFILSPETISGIAGKINGAGGQLTFEDKAIAFCLLADGQVSPISAPWLTMKGIRSGFLSSWRKEDGGTVFTIDDTFEGKAIRFQVLVSRDLHPKSAEIYWEGRCILSITIEDFRYL